MTNQSRVFLLVNNYANFMIQAFEMLRRVNWQTMTNISEDYLTIRMASHIYIYIHGGRDGAVSIATRYGLDGPVIESR